MGHCGMLPLALHAVRVFRKPLEALEAHVQAPQGLYVR